MLSQNAAGKTTLLRPPWRPPTEGKVKVLSGSLDRPPTPRRDRLCPQVITLYRGIRQRSTTAAFYPRWNDQLVGKLLYDWEMNAEDKVGLLSVGHFASHTLLALGQSCSC